MIARLPKVTVRSFTDSSEFVMDAGTLSMLASAPLNASRQVRVARVLFRRKGPLTQLDSMGSDR